MKTRSLIAIISVLFVGQISFAVTHFKCLTNSAEREYVSKALLIGLNEAQIRVQTCDSHEGQWSKASLGQRFSFNSKDNSVRFEGFDSDLIFGELSEGRADEYIRIDVSSDLLDGKNGTLKMASKGSEVGRQSAKYKCVKLASPQKISKSCM